MKYQKVDLVCILVCLINKLYFQMSLLSRLFETVRRCLPVLPDWFSTDQCKRSDGLAASSVGGIQEDVKRPLSKAERLERLKKAFAEEYYCSGHPPLEVTGTSVMDCGCEPGRHGPLSITEDGQLFYPA